MTTLILVVLFFIVLADIIGTGKKTAEMNHHEHTAASMRVLLLGSIGVVLLVLLADTVIRAAVWLVERYV